MENYAAVKKKKRRGGEDPRSPHTDVEWSPKCILFSRGKNRMEQHIYNVSLREVN